MNVLRSLFNMSTASPDGFNLSIKATN